MPTITKASNYNINNDYRTLLHQSQVQAFDLQGLDLSDSLYITNAKAEKHTSTSVHNDPHQVGYTQSWVVLSDIVKATWFWGDIFSSFTAIVKNFMRHHQVTQLWIEVEFDANDIQNLPGIAKKRMGNGPTLIIPYTKVKIGANVICDANGYNFVIDHGPIT